MAKDRQVQESSRLRIREQLVCQRGALVSTGTLDLSPPARPGPGHLASISRLKDLTELSVQPHLKILNLSGLPLESLATLPAQPGLTTLIADNSQIASYTGLSRHPRLKSVSFSGAPVAERPNFRLSLAVVVGQHLASINGCPISAKERALANKYPLVARALIELGWDVETPVPSVAQFKALAGEYNVKLKGVDSEFRTLEGQRYLRPPPVLPTKETPQAAAEFPPAEVEPAESGISGLALALRAKLAEIDIRVARDEEEVFEAVESLVRIARQLQEAHAQKVALDSTEVDPDGVKTASVSAGTPDDNEEEEAGVEAPAAEVEEVGPTGVEDGDVEPAADGGENADEREGAPDGDGDAADGAELLTDGD
jgi:hypothetical protein